MKWPKHLGSLVTAPLSHQFSAMGQKMHFFSAIWENLHYIITIKRKYAGTVPFKGATLAP